MSVNVLIIGSGAREHALAWKLVQSHKVGKLYVAPGNGGTQAVAENVPIKAADIPRLAVFAEDKNIGLTIVGPDDPLELGIVDTFRAYGLAIFGPTREATRIESSKVFAKRLMRDENIPTAPFRIFNDYSEALWYARAHGAPLVVKVDGLALGKGVYPCRTIEEAEEALHKIFVERVHGDAGNKIIIEDFLEGEELSIHILTNGKRFIIFPPAQDHKQLLNGDRGPMTGGMGAVAPVPWVASETRAAIDEKIVTPLIRALARRGTPFTGLLYPGLMMTPAGPQVLEVNARFGDPEAQNYMRLLTSDLLEYFYECAHGRLPTRTLEWHAGYAASITLASYGYPGKSTLGFPIKGLEEAAKCPGIVVFHAGTAFKDGKFVTAGGRVLSVTAIGETPREAIANAYRGMSKINFRGMQFRLDIGTKILNKGY